MLGRGKDRHPASLPAVISLPGAPVIWSETREGCRGLVLTQARGPPSPPNSSQQWTREAMLPISCTSSNFYLSSQPGPGSFLQADPAVRHQLGGPTGAQM